MRQFLPLLPLHPLFPSPSSFAPCTSSPVTPSSNLSALVLLPLVFSLPTLLFPSRSPTGLLQLKCGITCNLSCLCPAGRSICRLLRSELHGTNVITKGRSPSHDPSVTCFLPSRLRLCPHRPILSRLQQEVQSAQQEARHLAAKAAKDQV